MALGAASGCGGSDSHGLAPSSDAGQAGGAAGAGGRVNDLAGGNGPTEDFPSPTGGRIGSGGNVATGGRAATGGTVSAGGATTSADASAGTGGASAADAGRSDAGTEDSGSASCTSFAPGQPQTSPTSVRLFNNTASNIYLGSLATSCNFVLGFTLEDSLGAPLKLVADACDFTCADLEQQGCGCPPGCNVPIVTLLAPGKYKEVGWTGTVFAPKKMPAACYFESSCEDRMCLVEEHAPTGSLTARASGYTAATCSNGPCVTCTPGSLGTCTVQNGQTVTGTELKGQAVWTGQSVLQINLQ